MKKLFALVCTALLWSCAPQLSSNLVELNPQQVELYRNGVGYFATTAPVTDGYVHIAVPLSQVDDVLKSLQVRSLSSGRVLDISLPVPAAENPALDGPDLPWSNFLHSLRGQEVVVSTKFAHLKGRLYGVDAMQNKLLLWEDQVLNTVILSDVLAVRVQNRDLALEIGQNLAASSDPAQAKVKITIKTDAPTGDSVRVSFVAPAPRWKPTHRLFMDSASADSAVLQSWALVDNVSGLDWRQVQLSLTAGSPRSEQSSLYLPQWVERPVAQSAPVAPVLGMRKSAAVMALHTDEAAENDAGARSLAKASPLNPQTTAVERAGLSEYRLAQPVTLPAGRSALLPLVDAKIPVEMAFMYASGGGESGQHPQRILQWRNATPFILEAGPLSLMVGDAFVGDAQVATTNLGADGVLAFATETQIGIYPSTDSQWEDYELVKAEQGILTVQRQRQVRHSWKVQGRPQGQNAFKLHFKQPKSGVNYRVLHASGTAEDRGDHWWLTQEISADSATVTLVETTPVETRISLNDARAAELLSAVVSSSQLDSSWRQKLAPLAQNRAQLAQLQSEIEQLTVNQNQTQVLLTETRESLKVLADDKNAQPLRRKLTADLEQQMAKFLELGSKIAQIQEQAQALRLKISFIIEQMSL